MIILKRDQFEEIVEHAKKNLPNEDCGLLAGTISDEIRTVKKIYFINNVDESPEHFSMDVNEQFETIKDIRANSLKLIGNFHSHPSSPARPSEEDKRLVFDKNLSYLILSLVNEPVLKSFRYDREKNVSIEELKIV